MPAYLATTYPEVSAQLLATALLSLFAFFAFKAQGAWVKVSKSNLKFAGFEFKRKAIGKSIAVIVVGGIGAFYAVYMRDAYVPAVFAMAVVAIIVAADHDAALEETPAIIAERLAEKNERLAQYRETYTWSQEVEDILRDGNTQSLRRVSAVIRHWEVPENFDSVLTEMSKHFRGQVDIDRRPSYARFITPSALRVQARLEGNSISLRYFYGLLFSLWKLYKVANETEEPGRHRHHRPARIRVGRAPIWVHVINDEVHQIIEGNDTSLALSRNLADDFLPAGRTADGANTYVNSPGRSRHEWSTAYDNIVREAYERGTLAEAYVASILLSIEGSPPPPTGAAPLAAKLTAPYFWSDQTMEVAHGQLTGEAAIGGAAVPVTHLVASLLGGEDGRFAWIMARERLGLVIQGGLTEADHLAAVNFLTSNNIAHQENENLAACIEGYLIERAKFLGYEGPVYELLLQDATA